MGAPVRASEKDLNGVPLDAALHPPIASIAHWVALQLQMTAVGVFFPA
jgi:hypothetical protein